MTLYINLKIWNFAIILSPFNKSFFQLRIRRWRDTDCPYKFVVMK
jgi:hypothetical protein